MALHIEIGEGAPHGPLGPLRGAFFLLVCVFFVFCGIYLFLGRHVSYLLYFGGSAGP